MKIPWLYKGLYILAVLTQTGLVDGFSSRKETAIVSHVHIMKTLENVISYCASLTRDSIQKDSKQCLSFLSSDLANDRSKYLLDSQAFKRIEHAGCEETRFQYDRNKSLVSQYDPISGLVSADIYFSVVCKNIGGQINLSNMLVQMEGTVFRRVDSNVLTVRIRKYIESTG